MKQLTVFEMEEISGGYSWDFSSITGALPALFLIAQKLSGHPF